MYKLKSGDKVGIKKDLKTDVEYGENDIVCEMLVHNGKERTISLVGDEYGLLEDKEHWSWNFQMFEYIKPQSLTIEMASDKDLVINCRTKKDAEYFCKWLDLHGKEWCDGQRYIDKNSWNVYKYLTTYNVSEGEYSPEYHYRKKSNKSIIRFTPSMIQSDPIWQTEKARKINVSETEKSNKNTVLTEGSFILTTDSKKTYDALSEIFNKINESVVGSNSVIRVTNNSSGSVDVKKFDNERIVLFTPQPRITNIKFDGKDTTVTINKQNVKVTCQDTDAYCKEQAVTQAIAKYCGYGTKKINELIEKFDAKEEEFKPYLICSASKTHYGFIGEPTPIKDAIGRNLYIGDAVELFDDDNESYGISSICKNKNGYFVMGIECSSLNGNIKNGWKIILHKKHNKIADGERIDLIQYIKSPPKTNIK